MMMMTFITQRGEGQRKYEEGEESYEKQRQRPGRGG
jgi:hypothetical protein